MLRSLATRADRNETELVWQVDSAVPTSVRGDPFRLRQVLLNLVSNAIKFTRNGEILVSVQLASLSESTVSLHFSVSDTGIGIPEAKLRTIFKAFTQADSSTTRQFGGTGLGLAIASRLVTAMGGQIDVDSEVGTGSTFHFTIELGHALAPPATTVDANAPDLHDIAALVVDDNATNRQLLQQMLASWGIRVTSVDSGPAAIAYLTQLVRQDQPLPLLLSDVHMPHVDGFMLVERLRDTAGLCDIVVILLTSGGRPGDAARRRELKIAAQLLKPIRTSELLDTVLMVTGRPDRAGASREGKGPPPLPPLKILLAEDGKANQRLACALLQRWGHTVTIAENGRMAVEMWQQQPYDLVLMDVQMPDLDGLDATREIRSIEKTRGGHIPIVAMTARAMKGDRERCLDAGMDAYVPKPVRRNELYEAMAPFFESSAETNE